MYKLYFKQALEMLKQNKFTSIISIAGTAIAIMMIMALLVTDQVKAISVAPEVNRNRTLYIKWESQISKINDTWVSGWMSYKGYKDQLSALKTPEMVSLLSYNWLNRPSTIVSVKGSTNIDLVIAKQTDANYFRIMSFSFLKGKPYTQEEFESGVHNVVITESTARKLFQGEDALGKTMDINYQPYKIVGVVKDVSRIFGYAHSDIWIPYTSIDGFEKKLGFVMLLLAKDKNDFDAIKAEVRGIERKWTQEDAEWEHVLRGPYDHKTQLESTSSNNEPDVDGAMRKRIFMLVILLLIPAINLSSFSLSRINKRIEEIGVRKAFGAKKHTILMQVLYENMITSLIGGFIGLILSYAVVIWLKRWLFGLDVNDFIPVTTLVSGWIFVAVFLVSLLLNLLSAGIPAIRASRMNIVDSINNKKQ